MSKKLSREEYDIHKGKVRYEKHDCPFCFLDPELNNLVYESGYWKIITALAGYTGDDFHLIAFPKSHKLYFKDFSEEEILDLKNIHIFCEQYFGEKQYFSMTRETMSNRSVEHYHVHFIAGKIQADAMVEMLKRQK